MGMAWFLAYRSPESPNYIVYLSVTKTGNDGYLVMSAEESLDVAEARDDTRGQTGEHQWRGWTEEYREVHSEGPLPPRKGGGSRSLPRIIRRHLDRRRTELSCYYLKGNGRLFYNATIHIFRRRSGDVNVFGDWFPQRTVATHGVETFGHVTVGGMIVVGIDCEVLASMY
jgi:hypothetical protein